MEVKFDMLPNLIIRLSLQIFHPIFLGFKMVCSSSPPPLVTYVFCNRIVHCINHLSIISTKMVHLIQLDNKVHFDLVKE